jgi:hypothetical protein
VRLTGRRAHKDAGRENAGESSAQRKPADATPQGDGESIAGEWSIFLTV